MFLFAFLLFIQAKDINIYCWLLTLYVH